MNASSGYLGSWGETRGVYLTAHGYKGSFIFPEILFSGDLKENEAEWGIFSEVIQRG